MPFKCEIEKALAAGRSRANGHDHPEPCARGDDRNASG